MLDVLERLRALAGRWDRDDLADRAAAAAARIRRPATVVAVIGQFKEGKSSLVNALIGTDACPVDDDLATAAVTLVHHAEAPSAVVHRHDEEGETVVEAVTPDQVRDLATEAGNPDNHLGVERIDLGVPAPLLAGGMAFVDTPGMGTIGAGHTAATLAFLPFVDALVLVTDASTELTAPELDFLGDAIARCPTLLVCLTKVDVYPAWRRIEQLDREHLDRAGIDADVVAVSSRVGRVARDRDDDALLEESGVPALARRLRTDVSEAARARATDDARDAARSVADQLRTATRDELALLTDPERVSDARAELDAAQTRLGELDDASARWRIVLNDAITDLTTRTTHELRSALRDLTRELDDHLEELRGNDDWERLARHVQARVADVVAEVFEQISHEGERIRDDLVAVLGEERLDLPTLGDQSPGLDLDRLWADRVDVSFTGGLTASDSTGAFTGAQRGLLMLGLLGRVLPGAGATLLLSNPLLLGAGVLLGGKQLLSQRERRLTQQRQAARTGIRAFLDDVSFELGPRVTEAVRELHRSLRDEVSRSLTELRRTYRELAARAERVASADAEGRAARAEELRALLQELDGIDTEVSPS